jgi:chemotaxis signal transduction protein
VDKVERVMHIQEDQVDEAPGTATGAGQKYVQGVARTNETMIIILDVFNIFSDDERRALENI